MYLSLILASSSFSIINDLFDSISKIIYDFGYLGIFIAALIETLFPIIPSELIFPLAGYVAHTQDLGIFNAIIFGLIGAGGSTLGALIIYMISLKLGRKVILRLGKYLLINEKKLIKSEVWFSKHGNIAVFLGRLAPGVRELISIPAGLAKMNILYFTVFTFIGSAIWSIFLTLIGYYLGEAWDKFFIESSSIFNITAIIIISIIAIIILFKYFKRNKQDTKQTDTA